MPVPRAVIDDFLAQTSLALVGVSRDGKRGFGNAVRKELSGKGYTLHVVHPEADRIGDQPCAHTLAEVAGEVGGVVLVTPPEQTLKLVEEAAALGIPRVWMQQGAESSEAIRACEERGLAVVHGECILMFAEPTAWLHRAHRWARGALGALPEGEPAGAPHDRTSLERKLMREVAALALPAPPDDDEPVHEAELAALPAAAQRYMRFMGVVGAPRDASFTMCFEGRFLFGGEWVPCECAQFDARVPVTRVFHMRLRVKGLVPTYVRDTYLRGHGHMLGKLLDSVAVVDDASEEVTIGECVTYLNDAVLMAPSMLLVPEVTFSAAGDEAFDVVLTDAGRTVRARVFVDAQGAVTDFSTTDRFYAPPGSKDPPARCEWRTPVDGWQEHLGRRFPTTARAVWMLPTGPLTYAEFPFDPRSFAPNPSVESAGG
ncbi:MAG: CoA-binding protein [Polyangiaceae bacterium]|nr:CoA-binding protein [Polyangiaceae bacterium]